MLDLADFVAERGGDLKKIKESQQKRFASEEVVDEVVTLYEEARRGMFFSIFSIRILLTVVARYDVSQMNTQINAVQKAIGMKKKVGISRPV